MKLAQQNTMGKKIWLSMHPRNFGSDKIVHMYICTYNTPSCKPGRNCAFQALAHFDRKLHGHPDFYKKKKKKPSLSFDYSILMSTWTWITKKELARAGDKKQRRPILLEEKHENFIEAAEKMRNTGGHQGKMSSRGKKSKQEHI